MKKRLKYFKKITIGAIPLVLATLLSSGFLINNIDYKSGNIKNAEHIMTTTKRNTVSFVFSLDYIKSNEDSIVINYQTDTCNNNFVMPSSLLFTINIPDSIRTEDTTIITTPSSTEETKGTIEINNLKNIQNDKIYTLGIFSRYIAVDETSQINDPVFIDYNKVDPKAPTLLKMTNLTDSSATIGYTLNSGIGNTVVSLIATTTNKINDEVITTNLTKDTTGVINLTGLKNLTVYTTKLTVIYNNGSSNLPPLSASRVFWTWNTHEPPKAPTFSYITDLTDSSVKIGYTLNDGAGNTLISLIATTTNKINDEVITTNLTKDTTGVINLTNLQANRTYTTTLSAIYNDGSSNLLPLDETTTFLTLTPAKAPTFSKVISVTDTSAVIDYKLNNNDWNVSKINVVLKDANGKETFIDTRELNIRQESGALKIEDLTPETSYSIELRVFYEEGWVKTDSDQFDTTSTPVTPTPDHNGLSGGTITGIVIGSLALAAAIASGIAYFFKRKN